MGATCENVALYGLTVNRYTGLMTNPNDDFPEVRLSDVLFGSNGFPDWGPRTKLSDAVIADGIARLSEFLPPVSAEGDADDEPCAVRCGYVSHGRDLIEHMRYEHAQCTECGNDPIGVHSVSHEPDCPRLQPGYTYPDEAKKARQAQFRAAQEIRAAHADPHWLEP